MANKVLFLGAVPDVFKIQRAHSNDNYEHVYGKYDDSNFKDTPMTHIKEHNSQQYHRAQIHEQINYANNNRT